MKRAVFIAILCCSGVLFAADAPKEKPRKQNIPRWQQMDYGPFLCLSITDTPNAKYDNNTGFVAGDVVPRGLVIKLADDWSTGVVYDMDLCRLAYAWDGAKPRWRGVIFDGEHGLGTQLGAAPIFKTPYGPGWASAEGSFKDPRADIIKPLAPPGPLPREWAKYKGLYRHGDRIVVSYSVGKTAVLEMPAIEANDSLKVFSRTFRVDAATQPMTLMVAQSKGEASAKDKIFTAGDLNVAIVNAPAGSKLALNDDQNIVFHIPPHSSPIS